MLKCSQHGRSNYEKKLMPFRSRIGMRRLFTSWSGWLQWTVSIGRVFQSHKYSLCLRLCLSRLNSHVWPKTHLWIVKIIGSDSICCCFTGPSINSHTHLQWIYPRWYDRMAVQTNEANGTETAFQVDARHSDNFPFDNNVVQFKFQYKKTHCA